ncbi:MAG: Crp/Fnr family transcriptional regulator [Acidobacteria bacterium]|nr:Crp/Fnr family transcriptional regulator [Acidobacteriota bacterium]
MAVDRIAALRATVFFGGLKDAELRLLAERAVEHRLVKDDVLFVAGEDARGLYVIVEGALRAFRESLDGREQVIHVERAGGTIAEVPVFDDGPYPSTVAAEENSTVLFIDKRDVHRLCLDHPGIALAALKVLASRLRRAAELIESLSLQEVSQRLIRMILSEARSRGRRTPAGVEILFALTHQQVAARIGSVREVVSRAFSRLQRDGLLSVNDRQLLIPDLAALAARLGDED